MDEEQKNNDSIDLSGALREAENQAVDSYENGHSLARPGLAGLIMKLSGGLLKDQRQTSYVMFGFVAIAVIVSLFLIFDVGEERISPEEQLFLDTPPSQFNP